MLAAGRAGVGRAALAVVVVGTTVGVGVVVGAITVIVMSALESLLIAIGG